MNVAIVGYGGMGREVEKVLKDRGHTVSARIDPTQAGADARELTEGIARDSDVAIEFSHAGAVLENAGHYVRRGLSAVVGTTGWFDHLDELKKILEPGKIGFLYGPNFSIGAHIFFALAAAATELANASPEYDLMGWEIHHARKKDSPSGTALTLGRIVTGKSARKTKIVTERLDRPPAPEELHIASVRGGYEPGTHTLLVDSAFDTIELTHRARNRGGFALGAVRAAEWLAGRTGLFEVNDFIREMLEGERGA
ncbi:MAG TPA: dihydrodipicolinate reductase C-terminal domain-containing protein [Spirochaetia bacterium]|nr:dihydrodipicolinate reductase C-terminal domain-containing protein [Spirochaetia bacterium]